MREKNTQDQPGVELLPGGTAHEQEKKSHLTPVGSCKKKKRQEKREIITAKCRNINIKSSGNTSKKHYAAVQVVASQKSKTQFAAYLLASVPRPNIPRLQTPKKKQNDGKQSNERTEGNQTRGELQLSAAPKGL